MKSFKQVLGTGAACLFLATACSVPNPASTPSAPVDKASRPSATAPAAPAAPAASGASNRVVVGQPTPFGTVTGPGIQRPSNDGTGNFRTFCNPSHLANDDPLVFPGQPGRAHRHLFFGNMSTDAYSTAASLLSGGESTCGGGSLNRSAYWIPALLDSNGNAVPSNGMIVYYKSGYRRGRAAPDDGIVFPNGLRILVGDPAATAPQVANDNVWFGCAPNTTNVFNLGASIMRGQTIPTGCPAGHRLHMSLGLPGCWDGINLDSPDHRSHVAFGDYSHGCPASHPVSIPEITFNIDWTVPAEGAAGLRFSSDPAGVPGGTTIHGDYIAAWDESTIQAWLTNCVRVNADCGVNIVADGIRLSGHS